MLWGYSFRVAGGSLQTPGAVGSQLIVGHGQQARSAQRVATGAKQAPVTGTPFTGTPVNVTAAARAPVALIATLAGLTLALLPGAILRRGSRRLG
jgi:hypothetical protein